MKTSPLSAAVAAAFLLLFASQALAGQEESASSSSSKSHSNNWAVIVCTSRFWFNYRHVSNALSIYRSVKRLGIPDSQIILMLSDDMACNARNPQPGEVFNDKNHAIDVYGSLSTVEVDYRGEEVTVENFVRLLTDRLPPGTPRSKRLNTDDRSNVLVYMTGHGGEGFLKFQDAKEVSDIELADAFAQMWEKGRYNELLFIIDTCQAESMYSQFYSPNIISIASSKVGEDSLSHHIDPAIGVFIIDRFTYYLLEFLETVTIRSKKTVDKLFGVCPRYQCHSTVNVDTKLYRRDPRKTLVTDFFGSVRDLDLSDDYFQLEPSLGGGAKRVEKKNENASEHVPFDFQEYVANLQKVDVNAPTDPHRYRLGQYMAFGLFAVFCAFVGQGFLFDFDEQNAAKQ